LFNQLFAKKTTRKCKEIEEKTLLIDFHELNYRLIDIDEENTELFELVLD